MPSRSPGPVTRRLSRERVRLIDLDQRPELTSATVNAFAACPPGKHHLVCGLPASMGQVPTASDLDACLGVVVACSPSELMGAIALCPYSDEQATLWGPASPAGFSGTSVPQRLLDESRQALHDSGFTSVRALVDHRNRELRAFLIANGFTAWKDMTVFERTLRGRGATNGGDEPVIQVAGKRDHGAVAAIIHAAFPETGHLSPDLATREREGYRHYLLRGPGGVLAAAAVQGSGLRSWLKLIAVAADQRGQGHGRTLLTGILAAESQRGITSLGLEVLGDNLPAQALYTACGFRKRFTATVLVAAL